MLLLDVAKAFKESKLPYAIAGGYAVALHGAVRGTLDIDLVISLKPKHLEAAEALLKRMGLNSRIPVTHQEISQFREEYIQNRNLIAWTFVDTQNPARIVDLLLTEDVSKQKLVKMKVHGMDISVLSIPSLIRMKKKAGRPQDLEDIRALEKLL